MKFKSIISASVLASMLLGVTSCKDDLAGINTDPSIINKAEIPYLFTTAQLDFEPADYLVWFYSGKYCAMFSQSFVPSSGYNSNFTEMTANGGIGTQYLDVLKIIREIDYTLSLMSVDEASNYKNIQMMLKPLVVLLGLHDTDMYGATPYTEACLGRYGGTLTPKFDSQEDLYNLWLDELKEAADVLASDLPNQIRLGNQDIVYNGNIARWAKFANSMRLKIAVRLLSQDKTRALQIAEEVANHPAGVMNGTTDNYVYNRGSNNFHFNDRVTMGAPNKNVVDFMLKNRDPRIRFFATKNSFNSEVIQAFFDAEALGQNCRIPQYILDNVDYTTNENGVKQFVGWKGLGEPWVRYYGIPTEPLANVNPEYNGGDNNYFSSVLWRVSLNENEKTYTPYSTFQEEMVRGQIDFTYPTKPGGAVLEDIEDVPWYGMAMSTAEVNLYLAELSLMGANLPQSAESYYNKAVELSPAEYDRLAGLNKIPYYDEDRVKDEHELPIKLMPGEIATMMDNDDYQLTGNKALDLEKVYLQQYIHFMMQPIDQFVQVRRSGVPVKGSSLIPWMEVVSNTDIPRRFDVGTPNPTDLMYNIYIKAYADQNFTHGTQPASVLNKERVWSDMGAPNFGEGPQL